MYVFDERARMRELSKSFPEWVANSIWGTAIWPKEKQRELLKQIQALDPETASLDDYARILGSNYYYLRPQDCDQCREPSWEMAVFDTESDNRGNTHICKGCLTKALSLFK